MQAQFFPDYQQIYQSVMEAYFAHGVPNTPTETDLKTIRVGLEQMRKIRENRSTFGVITAAIACACFYQNNPLIGIISLLWTTRCFVEAWANYHVAATIETMCNSRTLLPSYQTVEGFRKSLNECFQTAYSVHRVEKMGETIILGAMVAGLYYRYIK